MKLNDLFKLKILKGNNIYLLLDEVDQICDGLIKLKYQNYIVYDDSIGKNLISQNDFNRVLACEPLLFDKVALIEVTKVEELRANIKTYISIIPILVGMHESMYENLAHSHSCASVEEYVNKYMIKEEVEDQINNMCDKPDNYYIRCVATYKKGLKRLEKQLTDMGLITQCITYLKNGTFHFESYLAGKGIFYFINVDDFDYYQINNTKKGIHLFDGYEDRYLVPNSDGRDYSKFSLIDNLIYVITSKQIKSDQTTFLDYSEDGINALIDTEVVFRLLNPLMFKDIMFFDGIVGLSSNQFVSGVEQ